jgi:hypothetical protein
VAGVAQLVRASGCGPEGRGFETHHSPHTFAITSYTTHMARVEAETYIPADILAAAERAGLDTPLWYVGRRAIDKSVSLDKSLDDVVREAEAATLLEQIS